MAKRSSSDILCDNSTDANFRGWAQFIEDTFITTGGWVVTADTGQTTPATLAKPTAGNQSRGYRVYRMADTLQSTSPVYLKIEFGSGSNTLYPAIWITIGTGSDGAGTITSIRFARLQIQCQSNSTATRFSYGSAATNRVQFALFLGGGSAGTQMLLAIERTKDATGADTADGLLFTINCPGSAGNRFSTYVNLADVNQPTRETGHCWALPGSPSATAWTTNVGVSAAFHFAGTVLQPGIGLMLTKTGDMAQQGTFSTVVYGVSHTYLVTDTCPLNGSAGIVDTGALFCMRYE